MIMRDKNFQELVIGQKVHFGINCNYWDGEVIEVDNNNEEVLIKVTKREMGVGLIEDFNRIECSRYIDILDEDGCYSCLK